MVTLELLFSVLLSIGMWLLYAISFRKFTGMNKHLECDPGAALRESPCGTAKINALLAINGVRLIEHQDGWVACAKWFYGGGKLWLSKSTTQIGPLEDARFPFSSQSRTMISGTTKVKLFGKLATFLNETTTDFRCTDKRGSEARFDEKPTNWGLGKNLAILVGLSLLIFVLIGGLTGLWRDFLLTNYGEEIQARVSKTTCHDHATFHYSFVVDGQVFEGFGAASWIGKDCEDMRRGDIAKVFYLPSNPKINSPGDPQRKFSQNCFFAAFVAISFTLLVLRPLRNNGSSRREKLRRCGSSG
jgi:hypothetical protein